MDVRHKNRLTIVQELYGYRFHSNEKFIPLSETSKEIIKNRTTIHEYITKYASKFPIDKIAKVDLSILELSIYELVVEKKEPPKVVINEAVDLAKELGSDRSFAFINAILGKIYTHVNPKSQISNPKSE